MTNSQQQTFAHSSKPPMAREIAGLIACMLVGAAIGLALPGKAEGLVGNAIVVALLACIAWKRRRKSVWKTVAICFATVLVAWPLTQLILDWIHQYY